MTEAEHHHCELVRDFFAVLSTGDLEALRPRLHPDAEWEVMRATPGERSTAGRDAIVDDFLAPVRARFEPGDPKVTVDTVFSAGNHVAVETRASGTMLSGIGYSNRYAWVIEVADGLLWRIREYMDTAYARTTR